LGRERPDPHLAEQVVSHLASRPAGDESVHGGLVPPDDLDERVGTAPRRLLDQRAIGLHVPPPEFPLTFYGNKAVRAFAGLSPAFPLP
jgi:hypothetical protein